MVSVLKGRQTLGSSLFFVFEGNKIIAEKEANKIITEKEARFIVKYFLGNDIITEIRLTKFLRNK